jgi:pectate lyase
MSAEFTYEEFVTVVQETDKAICIDDDSNEIWVPKSQITDHSEVWQKGDDGYITVTEWWAEKQGWL